MMRAKAMLAAGLLAVSVVGAAACGGDDGGNELSQSAFKSKTDAACDAMTKKLDAIVTDVDVTKDEQVKDLAKKYSELLHDTADKLRDIGFPKGKKDAANEFYDQIDKAADKLADDPDVLKGSDAPDEFKKMDELSKGLGITNCGNDGSGS
jgi:hypothetical protein